MIPYNVLKYSKHLEVGEIFWHKRKLYIVIDTIFTSGESTVSNFIEDAWHVVAKPYKSNGDSIKFVQDTYCYFNNINKSLPVVGYAEFKIKVNTKPKRIHAKHKKISRSNSKKGI